MEKKTVRDALIALNGGIANIGYAEENLWFNEKPEYAGFTAKLKEFMAAESRFHTKEDRRMFPEAVRKEREGFWVIRSSSSSV